MFDAPECSQNWCYHHLAGMADMTTDLGMLDLNDDGKLPLGDRYLAAKRRRSSNGKLLEGPKKQMSKKVPTPAPSDPKRSESERAESEARGLSVYYACHVLQRTLEGGEEGGIYGHACMSGGGAFGGKAATDCVSGCGPPTPQDISKPALQERSKGSSSRLHKSLPEVFTGVLRTWAQASCNLDSHTTQIVSPRCCLVVEARMRLPTERPHPHLIWPAQCRSRANDQKSSQTPTNAPCGS